MIENKEERKQKLLQYLNEKYKEEPRKWWQSAKPVYKTTWDFGNTMDDFRRERYEIIIRYNKKEAAGLVAFLIFIGALVFHPWNEAPPNFIGIVFTSLIAFGIIRTLLDRRPKIIMNKDGIWTNKWNMQIAWQNIAASYIKITDDSDSTSYQLIIHYYDSATGIFYEIYYPLGGLDVTTEAIAYYIEYWKMKSK